MRKFKHKPTGEIFTEINNLEMIGLKDSESDGLTLPTWLLEQGDDWEEIKKEPNYLITAFRAKDGSVAFITKQMSDEPMYGLGIKQKDFFKGENSIEDGQWEIFKVKNSKGEEFTIGDSVFFQNFDIKGEVFIIDNFFINKEDVVLARSGKDRFAICENIRTINKVKSPIYTTTDGVDVFEGDRLTLYPLGKDLTIGTLRSFVVVKAFSEQDKEVADRYLTFTSEENRDKYIKENARKPLFTTDDGVELFNDEDKVFAVLTKANWAQERISVFNCSYRKSKDWKYFSTSEARAEYIKQHKPFYSMADIEKVYQETMYIGNSEGFMSKLKKLGK